MGHKGNRCQTEYGAATRRSTWCWRRSAVYDCFLVNIVKFFVAECVNDVLRRDAIFSGSGRVRCQLRLRTSTYSQ